MRFVILLCILVAVQGDKFHPVGHSYSGLSFGSSGGAGGFNGDGSFGNAAGGGRQLNKEYYSFAANDADFAEPAGSDQAANLARQRLQVVFVKGPEDSGVEDAAVELARQASDKRTDIFVLNKQTDLTELANKLNQAADSTNTSPEVNFVKYRTPQDAENAQREIQSQYDSLGGHSKKHFGGIAPALNFASKPEVSHEGYSSHKGSYIHH